MSCPFRNLLGSKHTSDGKGQCPFSSKWKDSSEGSANSGEVAQVSQQKQTTGQCPFGFDSSSIPKMSILHCTLCTSLLYECVELKDCGHRFCKFCVERFKDCPVCGEDIKELQQDKDMQGIVCKYIEAHCGDHTIWEIDSGLPPGKVDDPSGMERSVASFYLQLGIRSYIGGNLQAAKSRLQLCCDNLEQQISESKDVEAHLRCQAGTVCGSLGDCSKRLGDKDSAISYYQKSIGHLEAAPDHPEANSELSVSFNKLGDLHYLMDDVKSAKKYYAEALRMREKIVNILHKPTAGQLLELAVSFTKVADAEQVLHNEAEHNKLLSKAKMVLDQIECKGKTLTGKQATIYSSLSDFLRGT